MPSLAVETRHLLLLTALAEAGSLSAAARRLHLSTSALSQQLRELEERLGGALFERRWRRLVITPAGQRLTEAARVVLSELERSEAETRALLRDATSTLRLATACHQSFRWLPALLKSFAASYPGVEVTIVSEAAAAPHDWLLERKLDVALVADAKPDARLQLTPLFRDELVGLVGRGHAWYGRSSVPLTSFADEHVWADDGALRPDTSLGRALLQAGDVKPRKVTTVPLAAGAPIEMARANLGMTVIPRWAIEPALVGGALHVVRLGPSGIWLHWSLATRSERPEPPLAAFIAALRLHHPRATRRSRRGGAARARGLPAASKKPFHG